ncbi:MAG TPA: protein kinase, partial [Pseudonocardiaceae bacterium]|nr:protein kinase [Pseudonocardiaceae bacterium]
MSDFWVGPVSAPETYRLVSLLGGGGEGEVWKAILPLSTGGRREVAVKISRSKPDDDTGRWEQFGHLLRSMSHPGLVRVTDVFLGPGMHRHGEHPAGTHRYVVMDYIEGSNLREWAAENTEATASQRLRLLGMVAAALDEMHSGASTQVPVAHGDVKPSNIVVRPDGAAILVDLGLARLADADGVTGRSAAYAAPELRTRGAQATPEADRYAFAVTVAHVLTGQAPPVDTHGWLNPPALHQLLASNPLTARRHMLVNRIMTAISSPPETRPSQLREWLDGAVESLSQLTSTGISAVQPLTPTASATPKSPTPESPTTESPTPNPADEAPQPPPSSNAQTGRQTAGTAGEQFGPYRLEALLGRGGMGEVYRAVDTNRNRTVALKRLPAGLADDPEFQARFKDESALAARLNEPHIIPIHDFGEIDGRLFIDMRLVEGTDLAGLLAEHGPLTPSRAIHVIRQVASALDSAHAAGLVHRDVKPGNVLLRTTETDTGTDLDDEGQDFAYLVDFGIARVISSTKPGLTGTRGAIGSLTYMAPERFGSTPIDHRVDIYALGCLLYETLTGQQPFPLTDTAALIHAHLDQDPPKPSHTNPAIPAALDTVIATAMAKDPNHRYPTATALATAARNALTQA